MSPAELCKQSSHSTGHTVRAWLPRIQPPIKWKYEINHKWLARLGGLAWARCCGQIWGSGLMHQNKQVRAALFVESSRLHKKHFFGFRCFDDGAELRGGMCWEPSDEEAAVGEVFSYFTYVRVAIPQYTNTTNKNHIVKLHQNVAKVVIVQNGPCHVSIILRYFLEFHEV